MFLDGRFRFDNYVVGAANRLAVAAAHAVAESPGTVYNPLFVYSSSGMGKTHLLGAIGHAARERRPALSVEYISLEDFVEQWHQAVSAGQTDAFRRRSHHLDLLILDDAQFLVGRRETQSEMLRLFNALHIEGKQVVMASDRPPNELADVDERLVSRLSGGLIVDIGAPDYETRVAILRRKCTERTLDFDASVLDALAGLPFTNVRELQGALNRLVAHASVENRTLTARDVKRVMGVARPGTPPAALRRTPAAMPRIATPVETPSDEFESFLSDITVAVAMHADSWRARLGERIAFWQDEGVQTGMLERALEMPDAPDLDVLEDVFRAARDRLRTLEAEVSALDPTLAGHAVFRDPDRLAEADALLELTLLRQYPPPAPSPAHRLEHTAVHLGNQVAVRAAHAVVAEPAARYNPLVVHGPTGVGKTELIHAIGNALLQKSPDGVVACLSASDFVDELIAALEGDHLDRWRARYRAIRALILDDIEALAGKERSQDELFHLFNHLHSAGRQIVFACGRPPSAIGELEERLRSRFEGGLVAAMQPAPVAIVVADPFFLDGEKVLADWRSVDGRIMEELR